jgi:hypothetical protein
MTRLQSFDRCRTSVDAQLVDFVRLLLPTLLAIKIDSFLDLPF